eukprot:TRINITY_DN651_c0_g1_i2.p1 TRINITY_DN651_c0_g1~~TRINITY_DN651_c0_g1_i2.p1  ORF type:complete len:245 (-),score=25.22 TRINITY_DN651_c0_g1_i2:317-1051(-)
MGSGSSQPVCKQMCGASAARECGGYCATCYSRIGVQTSEHIATDSNADQRPVYPVQHAKPEPYTYPSQLQQQPAHADPYPYPSQLQQQPTVPQASAPPLNSSSQQPQPLPPSISFPCSGCQSPLMIPIAVHANAAQCPRCRYIAKIPGRRGKQTVIAYPKHYDDSGSMLPSAAFGSPGSYGPGYWGAIDSFGTIDGWKIDGGYGDETAEAIEAKSKARVDNAWAHFGSTRLEPGHHPMYKGGVK